jgi:hypothetical protein
MADEHSQALRSKEPHHLRMYIIAFIGEVVRFIVHLKLLADKIIRLV